MLRVHASKHRAHYLQRTIMASKDENTAMPDSSDDEADDNSERGDNEGAWMFGSGDFSDPNLS